MARHNIWIWLNENYPCCREKRSKMELYRVIASCRIGVHDIRFYSSLGDCQAEGDMVGSVCLVYGGRMINATVCFTGASFDQTL